MKEAENKENSSISEDLQVYELGYHLLSTLTEENLGEEVSKIKTVIEKNGGLFIGEEGIPKTLKLAYEMTKVIDNKKVSFDTAYFGWIKFEANSGSIEEMNNKFKKIDNILRFILIKSVRESKMVVARKPILSTKPAVKEVKENITKDSISEEQVDQAIEELVAE